MARDITSGMTTAATANVATWALLVMITFKSTTVYVWNGKYALTWNSQVWLPLGEFGGISQVTESAEVEAQGINLQLSGIPSTLVVAGVMTPVVDLLTEALGDIQIGAPVTVWLAAFNSSGVVANPINCWSGRVDQPSIEASGETITISLACENRMVDLQRGQCRRYTAQDQYLDYPADTGFQFISGLMDWNGSWGSE
jgi:hypothetical protein